MSQLLIFLKYELFILLASFILIVFYQILTGKINLSGLLYDKKTKVLSPARIQKLVFSVIIGLYYIFLTYKSPESFPELPDALLYLLTGSSAGYLLAKAKSMLGLLGKWF